jgi:diguanylate cyclase (GGDEF)-like protein/PAS domain S-box-containing protein
MEKKHYSDTDTHVYEAMLEVMPVPLFFADSSAKVRVWNNAIVQNTGMPAAELSGKTLTQAGLKPEVCGKTVESSGECILHAYIQSLETKTTNSNGHSFCLHIRKGSEVSSFTCEPVYSSSGSLLGVMGVACAPGEAEMLHSCACAVAGGDGYSTDATSYNVLGTPAFYDAIKHEWHRYQRYQNVFSILSLEIDYFSYFESIVGQKVAGNLLARVVANIGSSLRRSDIIGQVAPNRFIILLTNSDRKSALKVANMLLDGLHKQTCPDLPFVMSASIGVVSVEDEQSLDKTLERADNALQRSIELGRNQITFWG